MKHALAVLCAVLSVALLAISPAIAGVPLETTKTERVVVTKTTKTTTCCTKKCKPGCCHSTSCRKQCCAGYAAYYVDRPFVIGKQVYQHDYHYYPYATYYMPDEKAYPGPAVYGYRRPYFYNTRPYLGYSQYHGWQPYYGRTYASLDSTANLHGPFVYRGGTEEKVVRPQQKY